MKQHYLDAYASLSEGLPGNDLGWVAAARQSAAARLDEVGFPTPRDAVSYILDTFPIVRRKDEEQHGEYSTRRVILEIYDAMQEAISGGQQYHTKLDPPPADPRCCHPASTEDR